LDFGLRILDLKKKVISVQCWLLQSYFSWEVAVNDPQIILQASEVEEAHNLSFWDALIVAAASSKNVAVILTEDLNHGQLIEGVLIQNPFVS